MHRSAYPSGSGPSRRLTKLQHRLLYESDSDSSYDPTFSSPSSVGSGSGEASDTTYSTQSSRLRSSVAIQRVLLGGGSKAKEPPLPLSIQDQTDMRFPKLTRKHTGGGSKASPQASPQRPASEETSASIPRTPSEHVFSLKQASPPYHGRTSSPAPSSSPSTYSIDPDRTPRPEATRKPLPPQLEKQADQLKTEALSLLVEMQALQLDLERLDSEVDRSESTYRDAWGLMDSWYWSSFEVRRS